MTPRLGTGRVAALTVAVVAALTVAVVAVLSIPQPASAHLRSGTVAVDYRISILSPRGPAYTARAYQSDRAITLTVRPGHVVMLLGYLREPVFRLDRAGLSINMSSPTAATVGVLKKDQRSSSSAVRWRLEPGVRSVVWHDARAQLLPPGAAETRWTVPLVVDGRAEQLAGALRRIPRPPILPWLAVLCGVVLVSTAPLLHRGRADRLVARSAAALALLASAASVVIALSFALDTYASPGTWIAGLDEIAFLAVGIGLLLRGPENLRVPSAIGIGFLAVAIALSKGAVFLHPVVLAVLPASVTRLTVAIGMGAGAGAALLGGASYARSSVGADPRGKSLSAPTIGSG